MYGASRRVRERYDTTDAAFTLRALVNVVAEET